MSPTRGLFPEVYRLSESFVFAPAFYFLIVCRDETLARWLLKWRINSGLGSTSCWWILSHPVTDLASVVQSDSPTDHPPGPSTCSFSCPPPAERRAALTLSCVYDVEPCVCLNGRFLCSMVTRVPESWFPAPSLTSPLRRPLTSK